MSRAEYIFECLKNYRRFGRLCFVYGSIITFPFPSFEANLLAVPHPPAPPPTTTSLQHTTTEGVHSRNRLKMAASSPPQFITRILPPLAVLWIGVVLTPIRIRIQLSIHCRAIGSVVNRHCKNRHRFEVDAFRDPDPTFHSMPIQIRILSQSFFYTYWKIGNLFDFYSQQLLTAVAVSVYGTSFYLCHQCDTVGVVR